MLGYEVCAAFWRPSSRRWRRQARRPAQTAVPAPPAAEASRAETASHQALLDRYCVTCHNERMSDRGTVPFAFDGLDIADVGADAAAWEKVVRKLRLGMMPPSGRPRPDRAAHDGFVTWLETALRRGGGRFAVSRPSRGAADDVRRVRQRGPEPARSGRGRALAAVSGRRRRSAGVRHERRRAVGVAGAVRTVSLRGEPRQPPRGRGPDDRTGLRRRHLQHAPAALSG